MASCNRLFRAEKGTANFNAFRTLLFGVVGCMLILIGIQPTMYFYDKFARDRPWIFSKDEAYVSPTGRWAIQSETLAPRRVSGDRILTQYAEEAGGNDEIICVTERRNTWEGERLKHWTVEGFLGFKCPLPKYPFYVCSTFVLEQESGAVGTFATNKDGEPFCTNTIDPSKGDF